MGRGDEGAERLVKRGGRWRGEGVVECVACAEGEEEDCWFDEFTVVC